MSRPAERSGRGDAPRFTGRACADRRAALREIADGHATLATSESMREHAAGCERCASELRMAERLRRMLDGLVAPESTRADEDAFVASVLGRLDAAPAPSRRRPGPRPAAADSATRAAPIAAALALVTLGGAEGPDGGVDRAAASAPEAGSPEAGSPEAVSDEAVSDEAVSDEDRPADGSAGAPAPPAHLSAAPSIDLGPGAQPVDMDAFAAAVGEASGATGFEPDATGDPAPFLAALESRFGGDPRRAARRVLRGDAPSDLDGAAARILGSASDLQDRALLERTLDRTGPAGLRATAQRGPAGVEAVWRIASADDALAGEARALLAGLTVAGDGPDPLDHVPAGTPAEAIVAVAAASPAGAAGHLDRWLATGDGVWLELFDAAPSADAALASLLDRPRVRTDEGRVLAALRRRPIAEGVEPTMDALRSGAPGAPETLARLAVVGGAEALIGATRSGLLRTRVEDSAWASMIAEAPRAILAAAADDGDLEVALESLARCAGASELDGGGLDLALTGAEDVTRPERLRELALIVVASREPAAADDDLASPRSRAGALREDGSVDVAAAAWLAWIRLGGVPGAAPPEIARALARGGPPSVARLRLGRAIARVRSGAGAPD